MGSTIEEGLVAYVEAHVASIGKGYPLQVPQDAAYPAWAYEVVSDEDDLVMEGATGWHTLQLTAMFISVSYSASKTAANALRAALNGYRGALGSRTAQYCKVVLKDGWSDLHQMPVAVADVRIDYV